MKYKFMTSPVRASARLMICAAIPVMGIPAASAAEPASSITLGFGSYSQDFNTLAATGTSTVIPGGWGFVEAGTNGNTTYTAGTGSGTTGDTYSFGSTAGDRALGGLQSGTLTPTLGAKIVNGTGLTIFAVDVSYKGEQWRLGAAGRTDRLDFQYSTTATTLASTTGYTDVNALDFSAPVSTGTARALDGNANSANLSSNISGLSIADGGSLFVRWSSFDATGADDGLAIDDVSVKATSVGTLAGSTFSWTLGNTITGQGQTLSIGASTIFDIATGMDLSTLSENTSWTWGSIFSGFTASPETFANFVLGTSPTSDFGSFSLSSEGVQWSAVPEPTSALAGLLLGAGLIRRRRKA